MGNEADDAPRRISRRGFIGASVAVGGVLAGTAHASRSTRVLEQALAATAPRRGGTLLLGTPQPIQTLDPHAFGIYNNRNAWPGLYNGLTQYDAQLNPLPDLATSWTTSKDGRTWVFRLKTDVRFHNGKRLTAQDVKYSIERVLDPKTVAGVYAQGIQEVAAVNVVNPTTVRLVLKRPSALLLAGLARVMIIPANSGPSIATKAVGTGPFKLQSYTVNDQLVLTRFDGYVHRQETYLDGVTVKTVPDATSLFTAFLSGGVHAYWQLDPKYLNQLRGHSNVTTLQAPTSAVVKYLSIDNGSPPFNNVEARQALLYALDLTTINQLVFAGSGKLTSTNNFLPPGHWAQARQLKAYPYDPEQAKSIFNKLGVKQLSYVGLNIVPWTKGIGDVLQQSMSQIGVNLNVTMPELSVWTAAYKPNPGPGAIVPNAALPDYDPAFIWAITDPAVNTFRFTNPRFGQLLQAGRATSDKARRKQIYGDAQKIWNSEVPAPVIAHDAWIHGVATKVRNLIHMNSGDLDYRRTWLA